MTETVCLTYPESWYYAYGFASPEQRAAADAHMERCSSCIGRVALMMELSHMPEGREEEWPEVPGPLRARLSEVVPLKGRPVVARPEPKVKEKAGGKERAKPDPEPKSPVPRRGEPQDRNPQRWIPWVVAAALVAVVGLYLLTRPRGSKPNVTPLPVPLQPEAIIPQNSQAPTPVPEPSEDQKRQAVGLYERGMAESSAGRFPEAVYLFSQAIEMNSFFAEAYAQRASAYYNMEELEKSLADYDRAMGLGMRTAPVYAARAMVRRELQDVKGAEEDARTATGMNSGLTSFDRAQIRMALGDYPGAIQEYTADITSNPQHAEGFMGRGQAQLMTKDTQNAIRDFEMAIRLKTGLRRVLQPKLDDLRKKKK